MQPLRLATRQSPLAIKQCMLVVEALRQQNIVSTIVGITTRGDKCLDKPLSTIGGKELFIKELQRSLLENQSDIAVHSLKDMAAKDTPGFCLAAVGFEQDAHDVVVSRDGKNIDELPERAKIGTASPRREALLRRYYPHLQPVLVRGNLQTRLRALENGDYAAILLAAAGLKRLELDDYIQEYLPIKKFIPAVGQGVLALECLSENLPLINCLSHINVGNTMLRIRAERAFSAAMGGNCTTPLAAHATLRDGALIHLHAFYATPEGDFFDAEVCANNPEQVGLDAAQLIQKKILDK